MSWKYGVILEDHQAFIRWLSGKLSSQMTEVHVHHTYSPNHGNFNGNNHRALQDGMRRYHKDKLGWSDSAQHITIFPDGKIVTGRNINTPPASASGYNDSDGDDKHPFMFEMIGNFDKGHDKLDGKQLATTIGITRYFYNKGAKIRFHREMANKTCPGSGIDKSWFVNKVKDVKPESYDRNAEYHRLLYLKDPMMRGEDIKTLQKRLQIRSIDGIFGSQTQSSVKNWQRVHDEMGQPVSTGKGLTVDGIVGSKTWGALFPNTRETPPMRRVTVDGEAVLDTVFTKKILETVEEAMVDGAEEIVIQVR